MTTLAVEAFVRATPLPSHRAESPELDGQGQPLGRPAAASPEEAAWAMQIRQASTQPAGTVLLITLLMA